MSGAEAVQGIVVVFGLIFLTLLLVIARSYLRNSSQNKEPFSLKTDVQGKEEGDKTASDHRTREEQRPSDRSEAARPLTVIRSEEPLSAEEKAEETSTVTKVESTLSLETSLPEKAKSPLKESHEADVGPTLEKALAGTRQRFWGRIQALWSGTSIAQIDDIEEVLYTSDLGPHTVERLLNHIQETLSRSEKKDADTVREALRGEIAQIFAKSQSLEEPTGLFDQFQFHQPSVWMVVGVNGAGKTTSIGKIASQLASHGKKVLVAAGDTFRAAAGSQLKVWTDRAQVEIFAPEGVIDPSAVAFDAVQKGVAKGFDVIIIDTAGRLHTQHNLMEEIKKMKRVIQKVLPEAPHEVLLVLDSNQGQNALMQAKEFHKALGITGVVLTKLDGTAKGGVAVGVAHELELPIKLIGVGEKMSDLRPFSVRHFVESIL